MNKNLSRLILCCVMLLSVTIAAEFLGSIFTFIIFLLLFEVIVSMYKKDE